MVPLTGASAQAVGSGPLKIIVPFSPGALIDNIARIYADKLSARLGQPVVVENRPGAGGMVGTQRLLAEDPEKNTLLFVSSSYAVNPSVQENLPFDTLKDLSGVSLIAYSPTLVVVNAKSEFNSVQAFVDDAKSAKQALNYGSAGINSATDLVGRYFSQEAGVPLEHIPYKGVQEGVTEVVAGRIDTSFPPIALALPFVRNNQLKALAITSKERSALLPDVPTVHETVAPGFEYSIWYGVIMSAKTADDAKRIVADHIVEINKDPDVIGRLESQGLVPQTKTLKEFDDYIESEISKFGKILSTSH
ncbi:MAG: tripartite tricarboxylate transporter substrate binding protein [Pusillimonas sp.]